MASSREWANTIYSISSWIYFLLIIFQIPLFRVPCRTGICTTPIQVTCSQLIESELFPVIVVKTLLYPGAIVNSFYKNKSIPSYKDLLKLYKFTNLKAAPATSDLQRLEVLAGSYLSVAGAILGLIRPGRMSFFGTLLIIWGLVKEVIMRKSSTYPTKAIYICPMMSIAVVSAFLSIRKDVRQLVRCYKRQRIAKHSRMGFKLKHI